MFKSFRGKAPTTPEPKKIRITPQKTGIKKETYRSLQAVKVLYREALVVKLESLWLEQKESPPHFQRII